jgi:equilibrative nucleoside transporter 1/2/3
MACCPTAYCKKPPLFALFTLLGAGLLFPWNALISSFDFFYLLYGPTSSIAFEMGTAYTWTLLLATLGLQLPESNPSQYFHKAFVGFLMMSAVLLFFAFSSDPSYNTSIFLAIITGVGDGLVQTAIYPLAASIHPNLSSALLFGQGVAGILVSLIKVTCKLSFPKTDEGTYLESRVYFFIGSLLIAVCLGALTIVRARGYIKSPRNSRASSLELTSVVTAEVTPSSLQRPNADDNDDDDDDNDDDPQALPTQPPSSLPPSPPLSVLNSLSPLLSLYTSLLSHTRVPTLLIFITFTITLSLYPGVTSQIPAPNPSLGHEGWFPVLLALTFNVGDWVGRAALSYLLVHPSSTLAALLLPMPNTHTSLDNDHDASKDSAITALYSLSNVPPLVALATARLLFYALFPLLSSEIITSPALIFFIMFLFSASNGFVVAVGFVVGPQMVEGEEAKERVNGVLLISLFTGLAIGASLGQAFSR